LPETFSSQFPYHGYASLDDILRLTRVCWGTEQLTSFFRSYENAVVIHVGPRTQVMSPARQSIEKLVHWCERRPVVASLTAVAVILGLAGITVALLVIENGKARRAAMVAKAIAAKRSSSG
jgi:predicted ArsR family transcriptional regulator